MSPEKQKKSKSVKLPKHLQHINFHAAGIDVGSRSHFVAVPEGTSEPPVREFESFTDDLQRMADWLTACKVSTVVMESTGIYWIPVFEILESKGFEVKLVNVRHVKNVPGRKSDVLALQNPPTRTTRSSNTSSSPITSGIRIPANPSPTSSTTSDELTMFS